MPAWLLPAVMGAGSALSALVGTQQNNQQNRQANEALEIQRARLAMDQDNQRRANTLFDTQAAALNPMRQQLFSALAGRLGLPANAMSFSTAPRPSAPPASAGAAMPRPPMGGARQPTMPERLSPLNMLLPGAGMLPLNPGQMIAQRLAQMLGVGR